MGYYEILTEITKMIKGNQQELERNTYVEQQVLLAQRNSRSKP